jgi:two-component system, sensor histidine kinase and response regulator
MSIDCAVASEHVTQSLLPRLLITENTHADSPISGLFDGYYAVTCTSSGRTALRELMNAPYDAVLLDIDLEDTNSLDVLEIIRATPATANLPVILLASPTDSDGLLQGMRLGANDYITRPIDSEAAWLRVGSQIALKKALDERENAMNALEAGHKTQNRLFQMATHDLRSSLGNIRIAENMLRHQLNGNKDDAIILDSIVMSLDSMQDVIDDFLSASSIRQEMDIAQECVTVHNVIYQATLQHSPYAMRKGITLDIASTDGQVLADSRRLAQVMNNLVSNAIKYSPPNSTARLWTEPDRDSVRIYVADQGTGIPNAERHLLFTQFGKLSTRPTGGETSTGLGLWVVKTLVEIMGGSVDVDCPPDGGSIFRVELPAYR